MALRELIIGVMRRRLMLMLYHRELGVAVMDSGLAVIAFMA